MHPKCCALVQAEKDELFCTYAAMILKAWGGGMLGRLGLSDLAVGQNRFGTILG